MKKYIFNIFLFIIISAKSIFAGGDNYPMGARQAGMANSCVMLPGIWSVCHNQAGLTGLEKFTVGFHFHNEFLNERYGLKGIAIGIPTSKYGVLGTSLAYLGNPTYNETKAGLAYAKSFGDYFSVGIQMDYFNIHQSYEYINNSGAVAVEIGLISEPAENFFIGAHAFNFTQSDIPDLPGEKLPTILRFGLGYLFAETVFVSVETEKDMDYSPVFKAGTEIKFREDLFLRTGISTSDPTVIAFGVGYAIEGIKADIAFITHPQLGLIPHFSMQYELGIRSKKEE